MKPYFAKLLPLQDEIQERLKKLYAPSHKEYKAPMKLFLCSRDIQVGDMAYATLTNKHFLVDVIDSSSERIYYISRGAILCPSENALKIIGEISPEATWVKEGMEFDYEEVRISYSCEKGNECDLYFGEQLCSAPHKLLNPIQIKGPCGHFH